MEPDPILLKAARIMRRRGYSRGHLLDEKGRVCALGAIGLAAGVSAATLRHSDMDDGYRQTEQLGRSAIRRLKRHIHLKSERSVWGWSDSHEASEVIAALHDAATCALDGEQ